MTKQQAASLFLFALGFGRHEVSLRYILAAAKDLNNGSYPPYPDLKNAILFLRLHGLVYDNNGKFYTTDRAAMLWEMSSNRTKARKGKGSRDQWMAFAKSLTEHYPDQSPLSQETDGYLPTQEEYLALCKTIDTSPGYH